MQRTPSGRRKHPRYGRFYDLDLCLHAKSRAKKESQKLWVDQETGEGHDLWVGTEHDVRVRASRVNSPLICAFDRFRIGDVVESRLDEPTRELKLSGVERDPTKPQLAREPALRPSIRGECGYVDVS